MRKAGVLAILLAAFFVTGAHAQENDECLTCHGKPLKVERDGRDVSLFVDSERFLESIHGDFDCVICHMELSGVEEYPHPTGLERVDCTECHEDDDGPIAAYWESSHGQQVQEGDPSAPLCQDCHGDHYIIPLQEPDSAISPFNIPAMCAQCHAEGAEVERTHNLPQEQVFNRYRQSIHGEGLFKQGLIVTAVCTSCHTGHHVLPHTDPRSTIHQDNIVDTCTKCHGRIEEVHRKVVAGELWKQAGAVPICVECHQPHEIRKVFYDTEMSNADCLRCHADENAVSPDSLVDVDAFGRSVHARNSVACSQCHLGLSPSDPVRPCVTVEEQVRCSVCHEGEVQQYETGMHGRLLLAGDANAPACTDCHGVHETLEHAVPEDASPVLTALIRGSPTYARNVPQLCAKCHREGGVAAVRYMGPQDRIFESYVMSIHGRGLIESGLTVTAVCTDCHTAHHVLDRNDPESSIHASNIAQTCGRCHDGIYERYAKSIHSPVGNPDYERHRGMSRLPHCGDCHSSHAAARTDLPDFMRGIVDTCGQCHAEITDTYFETNHGQRSTLGDTAAAKCHDCHGAHSILPPSDPASTLSHDNIVDTCGQCHDRSHRQFAGYLTHATHHDPDKYPALYYAFWGMTSLLVGTFTFFGLHTIAWLPRSWKLRKELRPQLIAAEVAPQQFVRFPAYARWMHFTVIISFFGLAITGMMLKFSYTGWAQALSRVLGGPATAAWIHRFCAILTFGYFLFHLGDLWRKYRRGNRTLREFLLGPNTLLPQKRDLVEFWQTVKWFLGRGPRPHYGKWTYWEKFDYFAVFWGVAIIGSTGLCLWFPETFTYVLPGWAINVAQIIHSDEALLATGFIFTIHFFNTHFRPEKFPMDPVIFTGRMSVEELKHERPREYEELLDSGTLEDHLAEPPPPAFARGVRIFGFSMLAIGLTLVLLIIYAMIFSYR